MAGAFGEKKESILQSLNQPEESYHDLSPKGTVDNGIRDLIQQVNGIPGLVTTSSCAGRVSVYLEGRRSSKQPLLDGSNTAEEGTASSTTKGGGKWLFVSHDVADLRDSCGGVDWHKALGLEDGIGREIPGGSNLVHLKFEPMVQTHKKSWKFDCQLIQCRYYTFWQSLSEM
jgi:tRNA wybutosine-synthesizing protein 3